MTLKNYEKIRGYIGISSKLFRTQGFINVLKVFLLRTSLHPITHVIGMMIIENRTKEEI